MSSFLCYVLDKVKNVREEQVRSTHPISFGSFIDLEPPELVIYMSTSYLRDCMCSSSGRTSKIAHDFYKSGGQVLDGIQVHRVLGDHPDFRILDLR